MERLKALGRGAQIMLVSGVLLLISTFFNWQSVDLGVAEVGQNAWHGFWGVVMGLLAIALIAWLVARLAGVAIPIPFSAALTGAALAVLILVFALLKNLTDEFTSAWAWIGLALAAVCVVGAWLEVQAAGGVEHLKSQIPSSAGTAASTPAAEAPAAAPAEPRSAEAAPEAAASEPDADTGMPSTERET